MCCVDRLRWQAHSRPYVSVVMMTACDPEQTFETNEIIRPKGQGTSTVNGNISNSCLCFAWRAPRGRTMPETLETLQFVCRGTSKSWRTDYTSHHAPKGLEKRGVYANLAIRSSSIWGILAESLSLVFSHGRSG
jgi:hypothetical protein